ncbi:MAG: hypothetical protein IJ467_07800 [Bacteroidaceae bacterium]|nr:hypothetical protein [Bacteroidaceae bacterium]
MKLIKKIAYPFAAVCLAMGAVSCDDFFEPETEDMLDGDNYMAEQTEMYTGFLGIMSRMQAVGDKAIYLTETRGELLEPTTYSTSDLIALYNYNDDLTGNPYADPAGYYDVIIACNDYLANIREFGKMYPELWDEKYSDGLISSTLRVKVWAYLTLAEIYGQALWFNDPITEIQDLTDTDKFQLLDIDGVVDSCLYLMDYGYDGVPSNLVFSWYNWLDPDNASGTQQYRFWDYMVPAYEGLYAKLALWKGAALQAAGNAEEANVYYEQIVDMLAETINQHMLTVAKDEWNRGQLSAPRNKVWKSEQPADYQAVSVLQYDYENNQTNSLMKHFNTQYPNEYLLRPSAIGMARWNDATFNPGGADFADDRYNENFTEVEPGSGEYYVSLYVRDAQQPYQDDTYIYLFRADEYHFFLIEALNNLGRFKEAEVLMNAGISNFADVVNGVKTEDGWIALQQSTGLFSEFSYLWIGNATGTAGTAAKYSNDGIRNSIFLKNRTFKADDETATPQEDKKFNDCALADEYMLEFAVEGKTYPALIRLAKRWNDYSIVADRVSAKYGERASEIHAKIMAGGYWVPWDLQLGTTDNNEAE